MGPEKDHIPELFDVFINLLNDFDTWPSWHSWPWAIDWLRQTMANPLQSSNQWSFQWPPEENLPPSIISTSIWTKLPSSINLRWGHLVVSHAVANSANGKSFHDVPFQFCRKLSQISSHHHFYHVSSCFSWDPPQPPSQQPPPISTGPVLPRLVIPRPGTSGGGDQPPGLVVVGAVEAQLPIGGRLKQYNFIILIIIWIIKWCCMITW